MQVPSTNKNLHWAVGIGRLSSSHREEVLMNDKLAGRVSGGIALAAIAALGLAACSRGGLSAS